MTQPILEIKHLKKKSYGQNEVLKDISSPSIKERLFPSSGALEAENQPSFVQLIYSKHLQRERFSIEEKMS